MTPGQSLQTTASAPPVGNVAVHQCGASLRVDAGLLLRSETVAARICGQVQDAIASEVPTALRIDGFESCDAAPRQLDALCQRFASTFEAAELEPAKLALSLGAGAVPLQAAWLIRRRRLGDGFLNIVLDPASLLPSLNSPGIDAFWLQLWHLRDAKVRTAFWPTIRSGCSLLSPEAADHVVPPLSLQGPTQSAWMWSEVSLPAFVTPAGNVDTEALATTLEQRLEAVESAQDSTPWATPAMQYDAWFNRRVAVHVSGIGDLTERLALDPGRHATLQCLNDLFAGVRQTLLRRSAALARTRERLPAIAATDPCRHLGAETRRNCWRRRWDETVDRTALRHRNLLVMSPWSIFPQRNADMRYTNLLPLLAWADACTFRRDLSLHNWSVRQLRYFHRRAWAVNSLAERQMVVAEQP